MWQFRDFHSQPHCRKENSCTLVEPPSPVSTCEIWKDVEILTGIACLQISLLKVPNVSKIVAPHGEGHFLKDPRS